MDPNASGSDGVLPGDILRSRVSEEAKLNLEALALPPQMADQWQRPPRHAEMPAIVLDAAHFTKRFAVKGRFAVRFRKIGPQQTEAAVIS